MSIGQLDRIPGDPPRLRLTLTDETGYSIHLEMALDEADDFFRRGIAMADLRSECRSPKIPC